MEIKNIDTSKFLEDPKNSDFVDRMKNRSPVFDLNIDRVNTKKALTYIALMYDKSSYFRKDVKRYLERKYRSAVTAGFSIDNDGRFHDKSIEDVLVGQSEEFNKAVIQYVVLQHDNDYALLVVYEHNLHKFLIQSMAGMDEKGNLKSQIDQLTDKIAELEVRIFGGEETTNMRKALYEGTARTKLRLRPEDVHEDFKMTQLKDWSPYGKDYEIENVTFAGDQVPEDDS